MRGRKRATFLLKKFFEIKIRLPRSTAHMYTYTYTDSTRAYTRTKVLSRSCARNDRTEGYVLEDAFESRILQYRI